jgi:molecular chaperone GrpE
LTPETGPEFSPEFPPESLDVDDLIPGLAEAVGAEAVASGVIAQLEADCFEMKDKLLRALAESENIRRRAERDRKDAETYGGTKLARDLLAVHDNLDRALSHVDDTMRDQAKSFIEGVELTQRELLNAFAKHKIEKVSPATGEKFDPNRHQAMFEAPIPGANPGTVIEVMQPGFTIADRLLRPALVGVAKAAPKPEVKPESESDAGPDAATGQAETQPDEKTPG